MIDTENEPQPTDPPVNSGGGTTEETEESGTTDAQADPPVNSGGGGAQ